MPNIDDFDLLDNMPEVLPVVAITHPYVLFPCGVHRFRSSLDEKDDTPLLIADIRASGDLAVLVPTKPGTKSPYQSADIHGYGVLTHITEIEETAEGTYRYLVRGIERVKIGQIVQEKPYIKAKAVLDWPMSNFDTEPAVKALRDEVVERASRLFTIFERLGISEPPSAILKHLQSHNMYEVSCKLSHLLQSATLIEVACWKEVEPLQMDADLRLKLLDCTSDKEQLLLLKDFLDTKLAQFEAWQMPLPDYASQQQKRKVPTALEIALSKAETSQTTQPPAGAIPAEELEGGKPSGRRITLGRDITSGKLVTIDNRDRVRGNYVIGRPGFGKSIHLEQSAVQDAEKGLGFAFLDPHGDVLDHILCRMPQERIDRGDVIFVDPLDHEFPYGQNPYECASSDPVTKRQTFNQVEQIFTKIFGMSKETPLLSQYVRNITAVLIANQGMTMREIPPLLDAYDDRFRKRLVENLEPSHPARDFWKDYDNMRPLERREDSRSTKDRIDALINNDILRYIVGQSKSTIDFQMVMNTGKILLVKLPGDDEDITTLLGSVIINQLLLAALSRKNIPEKKRRQFNIYADEFQRFAIPSFGQLLVEARKYRIATICANQVLNDLGEQLRPRMLNAGCLVVFNVQDEDATDLAGEFNYTPPQAVKPKPVIPSNVLDHLNRHQHQKVRDFYSNFVMRLEEAAKQQPYDEMSDGSRLASYNFGEGNSRYDINEVPKVVSLLNKLLREAMEKDRINTGRVVAILSYISYWLGFSTYYDVHYDDAPAAIPQDPDGVEKELQELNAKIAKQEAILADDTVFVETYLKRVGSWHCCEHDVDINKWACSRMGGDRNLWCLAWESDGGSLDMYGWGHAPSRYMKTPEEVFAYVQEEASRHGALRKIDIFETIITNTKALYQEQTKLYEEELRRAQERTTWKALKAKRKEHIRWCRESKNWSSYPVHDLKRMKEEAEDWVLAMESRLTWLSKHLEHDLALIQEHEQDIRQHITRLYEFDTPDKFIAEKKEEYKRLVLNPLLKEREKFLRQLEFHKFGVSVEAEIEMYAERKNCYSAHNDYLVEKKRHDRFLDRLNEVLYILISPEGKIEVPSTQWQDTLLVQQTHSDKRSEIANALTHLPVGRAWVRLTTSDGEKKAIVEHVIDTIMPTGFNEKELERKKRQVVAYTRANYCKPRHEVEEEISRRQNIDNQPPTKRIHTLQ